MTIRPTSKSIHQYSPYAHRVHRAVKNRRYAKASERKTGVFFVKKKRDDKFLDRVIDDPTLDLLGEANGMVAPVKPVKAAYQKRDRPRSFPKLVCEVCRHFNQLRFEPKINPEKLNLVFCGQCLNPAYWMHYFTEGQMKNIFRYF